VGEDERCLLGWRRKGDGTGGVSGGLGERGGGKKREEDENENATHRTSHRKCATSM
jgi:hypothetical protein